MAFETKIRNALLEADWVDAQRRSEVAVTDDERQAFFQSQRPEQARSLLDEISHIDIGSRDFQLARFDLREVQDVVQQRREVLSR